MANLTSNGLSEDLTHDVPPLYERVGGEAAISAVVELLYEKILADESLQPFFRNISMPRLKQHQVKFISAAFGHGQSDAKLVAAHAKLRGLSMEHFEAVATHLGQALKDLNVPPELIAEVLETVGSLRPQFEQAVQLANKQV